MKMTLKLLVFIRILPQGKYRSEIWHYFNLRCFSVWQLIPVVVSSSFKPNDKNDSHTPPDLRSGLWTPASPSLWPGVDEVRCCWTFTLIFNPPLGGTAGSLFWIHSTVGSQEKHVAAWQRSLSVGTDTGNLPPPTLPAFPGRWRPCVFSVLHSLSLPRFGF